MLGMHNKLLRAIKATTLAFNLCGWDYTTELDLRQVNSLTIHYFRPTVKDEPGSGNFVTLKITTPSGTEALLLEVFENLARDAHGTSTNLSDSQPSQTCLNLDQNNQNL